MIFEDSRLLQIHTVLIPNICYQCLIIVMRGMCVKAIVLKIERFTSEKTSILNHDKEGQGVGL